RHKHLAHGEILEYLCFIALLWMVDAKGLRCIDGLTLERDQISKRHAALIIQPKDFLIPRVGHLYDVFAQLDLRDQLPIYDLRRHLVYAAERGAIQRCDQLRAHSPYVD